MRFGITANLKLYRLEDHNYHASTLIHWEIMPLGITVAHDSPCHSGICHSGESRMSGPLAVAIEFSNTLWLWQLNFQTHFVKWFGFRQCLETYHLSLYCIQKKACHLQFIQAFIWLLFVTVYKGLLILLSPQRQMALAMRCHMPQIPKAAYFPYIHYLPRSFSPLKLAYESFILR